jgi:hypothetical protein
MAASVQLKQLGRDLPCLIYPKVEFSTPRSSVKDLIAFSPTCCGYPWASKICTIYSLTHHKLWDRGYIK